MTSPAEVPHYWGEVKYLDGEDRVPLKTERCVSTPGAKTSGKHECRRHRTHSGNHKCICGVRWNAKGEVVQ